MIDRLPGQTGLRPLGRRLGRFSQNLGRIVQARLGFGTIWIRPRPVSNPGCRNFSQVEELYGRASAHLAPASSTPPPPPKTSGPTAAHGFSRFIGERTSRSVWSAGCDRPAPTAQRLMPAPKGRHKSLDFLEGCWCHRRDSNPGPQPYQGCALPLSYRGEWRGAAIANAGGRVKPQSADRGLDAADPAPHPLDVPPSDKAPKTASSDREAKLAEALRANLRRRKAGAAPKASHPAKAKSVDET